MSFNPIAHYSAVARRQKMRPAARARNDAAVTKAVHRVARTTTHAAATTQGGAFQARRLLPPPTAAPAVDPQVAKWRQIAQHSNANYAKGQAHPPSVSAEGVANLPALLNATGGGVSSFGGFFQNLGSDVLNTITSVPAQAQLVGQNALTFGIGGPTQIAWNFGTQKALGRVPGLSFLNTLNDSTLRMDKTAAVSMAQDYQTRWVNPLTQIALHGNFGPLVQQFYQHPGFVLADILGAKAAIGHAPNIPGRIAMKLAPESDAAAAASRRFSPYSAQDRASINEFHNRERALGRTFGLRPGESVPKSLRPVPFLEGPGGRFRPPRTVRSQVIDSEHGTPIGSRERQVSRGDYSNDFIARARQRATDRVRNHLGPKIEERANRFVDQNANADLGPIGTGKRKVASLLTSEAKYRRVAKRATINLEDVFMSRGAADAARTVHDTGLDTALRALEPDKAAETGLNVARPLSVEQAAVSMHWDDELSARGGRTPQELRNMIADRMQGEINARARRGDLHGLKEAQANVDAIRRVPDELLTLEGDSPAVQRVKAAIDAGRAADRINQEKSIAARVVSPEAAQDIRSRPSAIHLGGSRWGHDVYAETLAKARKKSRGLLRNIRLAEERGDVATAEKLKKDLVNHRAATKGRLAHIRQQALRQTPDLEAARADYEQALEELNKQKSSAPTRRHVERAYSAGKITGRGQRNLEIAAPQRGPLRHRPGQPTRGAATDYLSEAPTGRQPWAEYKARRLSRSLSNPPALGDLKVPDELIPHPPVAPGEARPQGISSSQGRAYGQILKGQGKKYKIGTEIKGGSPRKLLAARRNFEIYRRRLQRLERQNMGFTNPRRPELVGDKAVYRPRRDAAPGAKVGGARKSRIGMDEARMSRGRLEAYGGWNMNPDLMLQQTLRASENYTGKASPAATKELIDTIAYIGKDGKYLTADSAKLRRGVDLSRVSWINRTKLEEALKALDGLERGKWLDKETIASIFSDTLPETNGTNYIAVHKDAVDIWTDQMRPDGPIKYWDDLLTYWKGGLLALSPRWYINNTFGLALQYGLLAGPDVRSILRGADPAVRAAMERRAPEIARDTLGHEANASATKLLKVMQFGFDVNSRLEEIWRRAAYANRVNRILADENISTGWMSNRRFARALEQLPDAAVRSIARDVEYFIGDYRKFNKFEKKVIKRIVPFYSWLRVISKLTFGLPFRSPLRAYLVSVLGKAAVAGIDPTQYQRPWYDRSAMVFGNVRIGMNSANPADTVGGLVAAFGAKSPAHAIAQEVGGFTNPVITGWQSLQFGTNPFGNFVQPAPGEAVFGHDPTYVNKVTHVVETQPAGMSPGEILLATAAPGQISFIRKIFSNGRTPRDTTDTYQIIADAITRARGGKGDDSLYFPTSKGPTTKTPFWFTPALSALTGANVNKQDTVALVLKARQDLARLAAMQPQLARAKKRAGG